MEERTSAAGAAVYVSRDEAERGSKGPFFAVYETPEGNERWGFLCSNCDSLDAAMDTMGRIVCNECGNTHKPDEWDAVKG